MTTDSNGFENYVGAPPADRAKSAGGNVLPVAGYRKLCLVVDQNTCTFRNLTTRLMLERIAPVPDLGQHNLSETSGGDAGRVDVHLTRSRRNSASTRR